MSVEDRFLSDTKNHSMEILKDETKYRHLKFTNSGSQVYRFDLVTWPGHLSITGDMGTYTFSRLPDMFNFFRTDENNLRKKALRLSINAQYWHEKICAPQPIVREFRTEILRQRLRDYCKEYEEEYPGLWDEVKSEILEHADSIESAYFLARDFQFPSHIDAEPFVFNDAWEFDFTEYTSRYLWILYAIVWGIKQYDEAKK